MATQYSNKPIITDGLVYALDFGNQKSYVSGSATANSLKYETNLTSVTGSTSIPNLQNGVLFFTGSQWVERTGSFNVFNPNGAFTLSIVVNSRTAGTLVSQTSSLGNLTSNVSPTSSAFGFINPNYNREIQGLSLIQLNHLTYRYSSGSLDIFYNGTLVTASQATISLPTSSVVDEFYINGNNGLLNNFSGSLAAISVYNRALTINEVQSNYTIARTRYGLTQEQNYTLDENAYLFLQSAGITDPIITGSIDTFVRGLKANNLWDKMIAIYPFVGTGSAGTNLTGSHRWNLKEPSLVTYPLTFTGSWIGSTSGSAPSGSNTNISTQVTPSNYYPFYNTQSAHISILSYDTPVSSSYLMGTGMTEDLAISTLAGDYGTPAAAYSVRKVRTAYSGALMDVRRDYDNVTSSIGYVSNGDLDTGSLLDWVVPGRSTLPGAYSGLAAAYSLRRVSGSYTGSAIDVRRIWDNTTSSIGFDSNGNLNTGSLLNFTTSGSNILPYSNDFTQANWSKLRVQVTASAISGPYGLGSGSFIDETSAGGDTHVIGTNFPSVNTSSIHTISCFVKKQERQYVGLVFAYSNTNSAAITFDLNTTSSVNSRVAGTGYSIISSSINYVDNGWFRISLTGTTGQSDFYPRFYLATSSILPEQSPAYTGEPGTGSYIYGFQYTTGSTVQPYIETTGTARYNVGNTSSFGYVTQWYDQSGNGRHATQTTGSKQPLIVSSGSLVTSSGKPTVYFNRSVLRSQTFTPVSVPITSFLVNQYRVFPTNGWYVIDQGVDDGVMGYVSGTSNKNEIYNGAYLTYTENIVTGSNYLWYALFSGSNSELNINNVGTVTGSSGTGQSDQINIGFYGGAEPTSGILDGYVSEFLSYHANVSSSRTLIENNINNYYNIYTGSNQGFVARWYDQSGNNRHATQTTQANQPTIVLSGSILTINTKPGVYFDGVNDGYNITQLAGRARLDAYFVMTTSDTKYIIPDNNGSNYYGFVADSGSVTDTNNYFSNAILYTNNSNPLTVANTRNQVWQSLSTGTQRIALHQSATSTGWTNYYLGTAPIAGTDYNYSGSFQEIVIYDADKSTLRDPIHYGINNYYNIYTQPTSSNWTTSSFTIQAGPTSVSASLNNRLTSGISTSGPLGLITVSRTGSNSLTITRNGVTSSFAVPASGALSTEIYLGAINNNRLALGNSPLNISFASVGTGLTGTEVRTYTNLTSKLTLDLQRASVLDLYPNARSAYSVRKLSKNYTGSAIQVIRTSDNAVADIGFNGFDLDTTALLNFVGTGTSNHGYVRTWYDQSGFNNHVTQSTHSTSNYITIVLSGSLVTQGVKPALYMNNQNMIGTPFTASEMSTYFVGSITPSQYVGYFYNRTTTGFSFTILNVSAGTWSSLLVRYSASVDSTWPQSLQNTGYFITGNTGRLMESWNFSGSSTTSTYVANGTNRGLSAGGVSGWDGTSGIYRVGPTGYTGGAGGQSYFQEFIIYDRQQTSAISIQDNIDQYFEVY